jgi:hypothetical protein
MRRLLLAVGLAPAGGLACAGPAARASAARVEIAPAAAADRHARRIGDAQVVAYCDPRLRTQVELLFDAVDGMRRQGARIRAGLRVPAGWTTLTLAAGDGGLVVREPDYDARDPERQTRPDITISLDVLDRQTRVLADVGVEGQALDFDEHVLLVRGVLDRERVYLVRVQSPGGRSTGWRVAPTEGEDEGLEMEVESVPLWTLVRARPALLRAMLLPPGYMVFFRRDEIEAIVDPDDRQVWPVASGQGS